MITYSCYIFCLNKSSNLLTIVIISSFCVRIISVLINLISVNYTSNIAFIQNFDSYYPKFYAHSLLVFESWPKFNVDLKSIELCPKLSLLFVI